MTAIPLISENGEGKTHERNWHWHVSPEGRRNHHRHTHTLSQPLSFLFHTGQSRRAGDGTRETNNSMERDAGRKWAPLRDLPLVHVSKSERVFWQSLCLFLAPPPHSGAQRENRALFFSTHGSALGIRPLLYETTPITLRTFPTGGGASGMFCLLLDVSSALRFSV